MQTTKIFIFVALLVGFFAHSSPIFGARIGANEVQILPLVDTRLVLADGTSRHISSDAVSVMLNVTAVAPSGAGFITVWPCGVPRPLASHLNFEAGNTVANGVIAAIGANGEVCIYSSSDIDLVVDISGWFEKGSYEALTPIRLLDTRETDLFLSPTNPITLDISAISAIGVDGQEMTTPSGVKSVSLNVTTVASKDSGFLTVWPCDQTRPIASNLNFQRAQTVANGVIAAVGQAGNTCLYASQETHVVVDLNGWLSESTYVSVKPKRLIDTRETSTLSSQAQLGVDVHNIAVTRDSDSTMIPLSAAAAALNLTAVNPHESGYATVWPCNRDRPFTSNVNFTQGEIVPNNVISPIDTDGKICIFSSAKSDYVLDFQGWFIGGALGGFQGVVPTRLFDSRLAEPFTVDTDGDGVPDVNDAFPDNRIESLDTDGDGVGNTLDQDDDGDGILDIADSLPLDPNHSRPLFSEETGGIHVLALNLSSILIKLTDNVNEDLLRYLNFESVKQTDCLAIALTENNGSPYSYVGDRVTFVFDQCQRDEMELTGTIEATIFEYSGDSSGIALALEYESSNLELTGIDGLTPDVRINGSWAVVFDQGLDSELSIESDHLSFISEGVTDTSLRLNFIANQRSIGWYYYRKLYSQQTSLLIVNWLGLATHVMDQ